MSSNAANMSERDDIWLSRGFSVTCVLSSFIGAVTVGMLLGEPDLAIMLFGAVGGVMVRAAFYFVVAGVIRLLFDSEKPRFSGQGLGKPQSGPPSGRTNVHISAQGVHQHPRTALRCQPKRRAQR